MARSRSILPALMGIGCLGIGMTAPSSLGKLPLPGTGPAHSAIDIAPQTAADVVGSIQAAFHPALMSDPLPAEALSALESRMTVEPEAATRMVLAYAPEVGGLVRPSNPLLLPQALPPADLKGLPAIVDAYRSGDLLRGDELAAALPDALARLTAEWVALRLQPRNAGFDRIQAFLDAHPDWAANGSLRRRDEEVLYTEKRNPETVLAFFTGHAPETVFGKIALARAHQTQGRNEAAALLIRNVWRFGELSLNLEASLRKDFPDALTKADHKFRSDRMFYKDQGAASLRFAAYGGADLVSLVKARETLSDKVLNALPADLRKDPTLLFAKIQKLRRDGKVGEAAQTLFTAPRDLASLVSPDDWWTERRLIARKLLDAGDAATAYRVAAEHSAESAESRLEAEFHAGWIALRSLKDPAKAAAHFQTCAQIASSPLSQSRAAYWQGRTAEAAGEPDKAKSYFETAAKHSSTYYGQLARTRLGLTDLPVRMPEKIATGDERSETIRAVELLESNDQKDLATTLAVDAARNLHDHAQIGALAQVFAASRNARASLLVGKLLGQRGFAVDEAAFPIFGIPLFEPLANSAPLQVVYAIARQESAFEVKAQSSAGAKGLMQMIVPTARRTAQHAGVPFDEGRLLNDAAFNAQLGAAHLGELLEETRGSLILTFAAYNAGGRRVKEWISAYGDPREPDVDPIDWVERIPFTETRNYVQRVVENLEMYRARFGQSGDFDTERTLRTVASRP